MSVRVLQTRDFDRLTAAAISIGLASGPSEATRLSRTLLKRNLLAYGERYPAEASAGLADEARLYQYRSTPAPEPHIVSGLLRDYEYNVEDSAEWSGSEAQKIVQAFRVALPR